MQTYAYAAQVKEATPGDFVLRFRDVPEALSGGDSLEEAFAQAPDCLAVALEGYLARSRDLPIPTAALQGERVVALDPAIAARAMLMRALRQQGLSKASLAELLGRDEKAARRVLSGRGASLSLILQALRAVGVQPALVG